MGGSRVSKMGPCPQLAQGHGIPQQMAAGCKHQSSHITISGCQQQAPATAPSQPTQLVKHRHTGSGSNSGWIIDRLLKILHVTR
jgi:hypothetical protein